MIYVSEKELDQVEYLISQSTLGNHVLFDLDTVRAVFRVCDSTLTQAGVTEDEAYGVEPHIEKLLELPTLQQKKAYLEQLDQRTYETVVRTYFNIVENNIYENETSRH